MNITTKLQYGFSQQLTQLLEDNDLPKVILACEAAKEILQQENVALLDLLPPEIKEKVLDIVQVYKRNGKYSILSSMGLSDQTKTAKALYTLFVREGVITA